MAMPHAGCSQGAASNPKHEITMQEAELPVAQPLPSHKRFTDLTGMKFVRYTVLHYAGTIMSGGKSKAHWVCQCDCGEKRLVDSYDLRCGNSGSCGCLRIEICRAKATTHGHAPGSKPSPELKTWYHIKDRCHNPNDPAFDRYGGRGIFVCKEWMDSFETFYGDMGPRPSRHHSIERVENNGPYSKDNCIWADKKTQGRNKRNNIKVMHNGREYVLSELAETTGLDYSMLLARVNRGWPEHLLTQPTGTWIPKSAILQPSPSPHSACHSGT